VGKHIKLLQKTLHVLSQSYISCMLGRSRYTWLASFSIWLMDLSHAVSVVLAGLNLL
jgi:hypothetical protein